MALSKKLQLEPELTLESAAVRVDKQRPLSSSYIPLLRGGSEGKGDTPVGAVHKAKPRFKPRKAHQGKQNMGTT